MAAMPPQPVDLFAIVVADGDDAAGALQDRGLRQVAVVEDLHHLDLQRLATVFDAEPDADIIGVD